MTCNGQEIRPAIGQKAAPSTLVVATEDLKSCPKLPVRQNRRRNGWLRPGSRPGPNLVRWAKRPAGPNEPGDHCRSASINAVRCRGSLADLTVSVRTFAEYGSRDNAIRQVLMGTGGRYAGDTSTGAATFSWPPAAGWSARSPPPPLYGRRCSPQCCDDRRRGRPLRLLPSRELPFPCSRTAS